MKLPKVDLSVFDSGPITHERCGVIIDNGVDGFEVVELPNRADKTTHHFVIHNADVKAALPEMTQIVGVVHTHPEPFSHFPSADDIKAIPDGLVGMVYHPVTKRTSWYTSHGIIAVRTVRKR